MSRQSFLRFRGRRSARQLSAYGERRHSSVEPFWRVMAEVVPSAALTYPNWWLQATSFPGQYAKTYGQNRVTGWLSVPSMTVPMTEDLSPSIRIIGW